MLQNRNRHIAACLRVGDPRPPQPTGRRPAVAGSGLPIPRFVSLKSDRVNLRNGPEHRLPHRVGLSAGRGCRSRSFKEYEGWRQVRDAEGATGWVLQSFLSGRRTALVLPWEVKPDTPRPQIAIRASDSAGSRTLVMIEAGVIANVHTCDSRWCYVSVESYRGYIEQKKLWGVYENEIIK